MTEEEFYSAVYNLGITINDKQKDDLKKFANLLLEYNKHTNITAIRNLEGVYLKHFYDSLTLVKVYDFSREVNILDVGSGGGFPGIVLGIIFSNIKITLLDSNHKKSDFQKYIVDNLKLLNINVVHDRAENYFKSGYKYDLVVARAVANLRILSELCVPFVKINGKFIAMKGEVNSEIIEANNAINVLGGRVEKIETFYLSKKNDLRNLIVVNKVKESPIGYPRIYDKIIKKPL